MGMFTRGQTMTCYACRAQYVGQLQNGNMRACAKIASHCPPQLPLPLPSPSRPVPSHTTPH
jgi:hypothetical protein